TCAPRARPPRRSSDLRVRLDSRVGKNGAVPVPAAWERSGPWLVSTCAHLPPGRALAAGLQQLGDLAADVVEVDVQRPSLEQAYRSEERRVGKARRSGG